MFMTVLTTTVQAANSLGMSEVSRGSSPTANKALACFGSFLKDKTSSAYNFFSNTIFTKRTGRLRMV